MGMQEQLHKEFERDWEDIKHRSDTLWDEIGRENRDLFETSAGLTGLFGHRIREA